MLPAADTTVRSEAEKKLLAAAMAECAKLVAAMRAATPAEAERSKAKLDDIFKRLPKLPLDFKRKIMGDARVFERAANTRAADAALRQALEKAREDDVPARNRLVGEARGFYNKAVSLGADPTFRASAQRKIDIIMMTGGVEHDGPTIAKPFDSAPRNPNNPKG